MLKGGLYLRDYLVVLAVPGHNGPVRAFRGADAAAMALSRVDNGRMGFRIDGRHPERTRAHASKTLGASGPDNLTYGTANRNFLLG